MRNYRRFELHKGNKEKFWEIRRYDKTLYFREGNIKRKTGEKAPPQHLMRKKISDKHNWHTTKRSNVSWHLGMSKWIKPVHPLKKSSFKPSVSYH